jgi:hypothetical protein
MLLSGSGLRDAMLGRPLEISQVSPGRPARGWKGCPMWVYDGEQWTEEGGGDKATKPENVQRPEDLYQPELQVVEIVPVPVPKTNYIPPFPLP